MALERLKLCIMVHQKMTIDGAVSWREGFDAAAETEDDSHLRESSWWSVSDRRLATGN